MTITGASAAHRPAPALEPLQSPLRHLDPTEISRRARVESRNREVHLPPISTYRWWARRTEAVNGAIIDAVSEDLSGRLTVADVFAGGGVIPLAAAIRGHRIYAQDLNPWAAAGLGAMLGLPEPDKISEAFATLQQWVGTEIEGDYGTHLSDGTDGLVSHTFRVATSQCNACGLRSRMFPHALVTLLARRERNRPEAYLACSRGHLFLGTCTDFTTCPTCGARTDPAANYTPRRRVTCPCGHVDQMDERAASWDWEVVLVERSRRGRRELDLPRAAEIAAANASEYKPTQDLGDIPVGQETKVLHRHGFTRWEQLYPNRQRFMLEKLLARAQKCSDDPAVVQAIRTAIIGSAEMAGHMSRWDRFYLKSYESMAGHRFNLTTLTVEPNVWGTVNSGRGTVLRRLSQLVKAATWLHAKTSTRLTVEGPELCTAKIGRRTELTSDVRVVEGSSERLLLPDESVHLVLTDPPYHDDVQYSELSLPFRAWARLTDAPLLGEAVVNTVVGQLADDGAYEDLLTRIFTETRRVLRKDGHLIFSYANRSPHAWLALFAALQRSGLRAAGCEMVHSENETDQAKRGVRACNLDLILDLIPVGASLVCQHIPKQVDGSTDTDERQFLDVVAAAFLRVGRLDGNWRAKVHAELSSAAFLAGTSTRRR
jgi:putative DNA methylase